LTVNNIYSGETWLTVNSQLNLKKKFFCEDYLLATKVGYGGNGGVLNTGTPIVCYSPLRMNNANIDGAGKISSTEFYSTGLADLAKIKSKEVSMTTASITNAEISNLTRDLYCNNHNLTGLNYINGQNLSGTRVTCNELSGGSYFRILSSADFNRNSINNVYRVSCTELAVSGTKNCVQDTESFGKRLINAYETADYLFGDVGESTIENGECIVWIDDIFKEIISTNVNYQVFLTKYGPGDIWVSERNTDFFVVQADNDISFGWEIKAKRKGYENYRLEEYVEENEYAQENNTI